MKKRMIKLMTIFCMAGILTVNPVIIGLAEEESAVGAEPVAEEEESETETEESDVVLEEEAGEVSEAVMMSVNEAAMPVMVAAENGEEGAAEEKYVLTYVYNNGTTAHTDNSDNKFLESYELKSDTKSENGPHNREGYDFIGWEKDGEIYSPGATYEVTDEDRKSKNITFTAVWRQQVSLSVDGGKVVPLTVEGNATEKQVTYNLSNIELSVPSDFYESADKWVINDNGTPCDATDTMTVKFEDKNNTQVYNAVSVNVDGKTDVPIENNTINLYSCWKPTNGSDFRITNETSDNNFKITASNNHEVNFYNGTAYIDTVSDNDKLTFEANGWKLEKSVNELKAIASQSIYVTKSENDVRYYQCHELTIKDSDFERPINITYQDTYQDTDTKFLLDGKDAGNTVSMSDTIYAGIKKSWAEYLNKDIKAERGEYQFSRWKFLWNENEYSENEIKNQTIDFYNDNTHSLTVQPVWNGSYTCDANYPENQGDGKEPEQGSAEVGTDITLPVVKNIDGKYTFEGWLDSDEKTYESGKPYIIEKANETFTGQWKAVPYEVRFVDEDGTEYSKETVLYGNRYSWNRTPSKTGYTFKGWELDKEWYPENGDIEMPDRDITFTAQWSINSYKISYDGNGAAMGVPAEKVEQKYQTDYTIDRVVPTKTGYTFQGWSDGTTIYQPGAVFKVPARDVVLTAQWKANSHQVKYDGNGGKTSAPESKSADYNSNVSVAAGLEKDGYLFDGWEQISTGKVLTPGASFVMPDMDETLKAKWKIAYTGINGKGTYYLVSGQSYTLGAGLKVQGDNSSYSGNMTFYVPQSGYYTFE